MKRLIFIGNKKKYDSYNLASKSINEIEWKEKYFINKSDKNENFEKEIFKKLNIIKKIENKFDGLIVDFDKEINLKILKIINKLNKSILINSIISDEIKSLESILKNNTKLCIGSQWRFTPNILSVKSSINSGKLGDIGLIRLHNWIKNKKDKSKSFDKLYFQLIDLILWLFPSNLKKLFMMRSSISSNCYQLHLVFDNEGMAILDNVQINNKKQSYFSLTVIGQNGATYADDHRNMNLFFNEKNLNAIKVNQGILDLSNQIEQFIFHLSDYKNYILTADQFYNTFSLYKKLIKLKQNSVFELKS